MQELSISFRDPDRCVVRKGGCCSVVFGVPLVVAGVALVGGLSWGPLESVPRYAVVAAGVFITAAGAGLALARGGLVIDRRSRRITTWWGLLVPFRSTTCPLDEVKAVAISSETRRSGGGSGGSSHTYTVYPIRLAGLEEPLTVDEAIVYESAREQAEELAKFLGVGIEDTCSGEKVTREAGTLDESLRERLARTGGKLPKPEPPPGSRVTSSVWRDEAILDIPPKGLEGGEVVAAIIVALFIVVPAGLVAVILRGSDIATVWKPVAFLVAWSLAAAGIAVPIMLHVILSATGRHRLLVSTREVRLERRSFLGTKTWRIPADKLEEIEIAEALDEAAYRKLVRSRGAVPGPGSLPTLPHHVVLRSDEETVEFGQGLSPEEIVWLRDVVRFIVTAPE